MHVCKRRFLLDCVPKLIRHMRIFHTFSSCISALLPTLCNSLEVKLLKDKKEEKTKRFGRVQKNAVLAKKGGRDYREKKSKTKRTQRERRAGQQNGEGSAKRQALVVNSEADKMERPGRRGEKAG